MIKFKSFIVESSEASSAFNSAKKIAPYITSERYRSSFLEAADALSRAADDKEIYNARFGEYKGTLTRGIEYAYRTLFDKIKQDVMDSGQETSDLWSITSTSEINKIAKIYDKMKPQNKEALDFMDAIRGIPVALKIMKPYIKSGRAPTQPKPGQFVKPLASVDATKLATKFMTEASQSFADNLKKDISNQLRIAYNKISNITNPADLPKDSNSISVASAIFIVRNQGGKKFLELKKNPTAIVEKLIQDSVDSIINGFIYKNASKLALVLQKKDAPKMHKILKTNIRNGMVENTMEFKFNDGSSFILESSVVYKYSKTGKLFFQYPTRFKNVKLADGSAMKTPSEQKMIKEF